MLQLGRLRIRTKLALICLSLTSVALTTIGLISYVGGRKSIGQSVSDHLTAIRSAKADHIQFYLRQVRDDTQLLTDTPIVKQALHEFQGAFSRLEAEKPSAGERSDPLLQIYRAKYGQTVQTLQSQGITLDSLLPRSHASRRLQSLYLDGKAVHDPTPYGPVFAKYHPFFDRVIRRLGYNDLLLVDSATGRVVYSWARHADFAASLKEGLYSRVNIGEVFRAACLPKNGQATQFADFQSYLPSFGAPEGFVASRIMDGGRCVGVLILQLSTKEIDKVMTGGRNWEADGLGETGETYLIGPDLRMRSNSRYWLEDSPGYLHRLRLIGTPPEEIAGIKNSGFTILFQKVDTRAARRALGGDIGSAITHNYLGIDVISSYAPLPVPGLNWGILSEQDVSEAFAPLRGFEQRMLISSLALVALSIIASLWYSRKLVEPLEEVMSAARRFGQGRSEVRVQVRGSDEIAELGRTINAMIGSIEQMDQNADSLRRNIVHDLKTPVTVIKGAAETLLLHGVAEDEALRTEFLTNIVEQSGRLLDDLNDILAPIDESWRPEIEEFDLAQLIQKVVTYERHTVRASEHEIEVLGADRPLKIRADRRKVRRVIENLLSNTVKYSPGKGKRVIVRLSEQDGEAQMEFEDQGIGMTPEELHRALTEGERVVDRHYGIEGTGFGLDSCRRVVEAHHGRLEAESEKGKGSLFRVILPLRTV